MARRGLRGPSSDARERSRSRPEGLHSGCPVFELFGGISYRMWLSSVRFAKSHIYIQLDTECVRPRARVPPAVTQIRQISRGDEQWQTSPDFLAPTPTCGTGNWWPHDAVSTARCSSTPGAGRVGPAA